MLIARVVPSRPFRLCNSWLPSVSLVSYGVVTLCIYHNEFHCRTSFSHPFCLELLFVAPIVLWAGSLIFSSICEFILCLQSPLSLHNLRTMLQIGRYPWSLSLPTIRAAFRAFYLTQHDNSCSQRCLGVHSDNKSTAEPTHIIVTVCSVFRLKCVSDLSIVCVLGKGLVRGSFPISNYVVCVQSCAGSRGGYIIRFSYFVFCITGNQRMSLIHTLKVSDYQYVKVSDLWLFHQCAWHICYGIQHYTYTLLISAPAVVLVRKEA